MGQRRNRLGCSNRSDAGDMGTIRAYERPLRAGQRPLSAADQLSEKASDLRLLRHLQCVVDLNAQVADGALELGMSEQQLYRSEIPGSPVDQRRLGPTHGMGAVGTGIEANLSDPRADDPCVLAGREMGRLVNPAWE